MKLPPRIPFFYKDELPEITFPGEETTIAYQAETLRVLSKNTGIDLLEIARVPNLLLWIASKFGL